ncbi:hypothetical protein J3Q64DRAFT_1718683 [Phycomyces blakesleeanus]|uniref:F-box domain-containing protein n=1 Tax=Phycomyces blakesleeanus TaxID=4837 RepID=A0ABR3B8P2_PHYBL
MKASDLPFEILSCIASYLTNDHKLHASLVCRAWHAPFTESVWKKLDIVTERSMEGLCSILSSSLTNYRKCGYLVKDLVFRSNVRVSNDQFRLIRNHFQSLYYLWIYSGNISPYFFQNTSWWILPSLTKLHFSINEDNLGKQEVMDVILSSPTLKHLEIHQYPWVSKITFTVSDLETIHERLPILEFLSLGVNLGHVSDSDIALVLQTTPAIRLTSLEFQSIQGDKLWLYYWGLKYPNLTNLSWPGDDSMKANQAHHDIPLNDILESKNSFRRLKKATIGTIKYNISIYQAFFELLSRLKVSLQHLKYTIYIDENTPAFATALIKDTMRLSCKTLKTLDVEIFNSLPDPLVIPTVVGYCSFLVDISLSAYHMDFALDVLLNKCTALKSLRLIAGTVFVRPDAFGITTQHSLETFELCNTKVDIHLFDYLSSRCRRITRLNLFNLRVTGVLCLEAGSISINMPYNHFETLEMFRVAFYSPSDGITCNENTRMSLLALTQLNPTISQPGSPTGYIQSIDPVPSTRPATRWYHRYGPLCHNVMATELRELREDDIEYAMDYFKSFEYEPVTDEQNEELEATRGSVEYSNTTNWVDDLPLGYVDIRCASIRNFVFDNPKFY